MPPKPQVFKTPDGKEFSTKKEWRDYMYATFYSYSKRVNETEPLIKMPGDIDGQMFNISDCDNVTIALLDFTEQIQIDEVKNSRIFIGACTSSLFIRNCEDCVFYTCCRQLRLRDVKNCTFYIYSMSEVHIEFSNNVKFASFNGSYPEHALHLQKAQLNVNHNLWYDIFDHNDPQKTKINWSLLPEDQYEQPWYPLGTPCEHAIPRTAPGSVVRENLADSSMQSFGFNQLVADSATSVPQTIATTDAVSVTPSVEADMPSSDEDAVRKLISDYASFKAGGDFSILATSDFSLVLSNGAVLTDLNDISLVLTGGELVKINTLNVASTMAWSSFWVSTVGGGFFNSTGIFIKTEMQWKIRHLHRSDLATAVISP